MNARIEPVIGDVDSIGVQPITADTYLGDIEEVTAESFTRERLIQLYCYRKTLAQNLRVDFNNIGSNCPSGYLGIAMHRQNEPAAWYLKEIEDFNQEISFLKLKIKQLEDKPRSLDVTPEQANRALELYNEHK